MIAGIRMDFCAGFGRCCENPGWDGVTGISVDAEGNTSNGCFAATAGKLNLLSVWSQAISYTIFLRREIRKAVGPCDERLGVGAGTAFTSGEETDYLIRAIQDGYVRHYVPNLHVHHPAAILTGDRRAIRKARGYGAGMGHVVRKHGYPAWFKAKILARPLAAALLFLVTFRARKALYHLSTCLGRFEGLTNSHGYAALTRWRSK